MIKKAKGVFLKTPNTLKGVQTMLLAYVCFACLNVTSKNLYATMDVFAITFYRSLFCILLTLPFIIYLKARGKPLNFTKQNIVKGIVDFVSIPMWVMAITSIPIPEAVGISYLTPIITMVLAMIFLGDKPNKQKWFVLAAGFIGMFIILRPDAANLSFNGIYALTTCFMWSVANIITKDLSGKQYAVAVVHITNIFICLISLPFFITAPHMVNSYELMNCLLMSTFAGLGYFFLTKACSYTQVSNLLPYDYFRLIFATLVAYIFFNETLTIYTFIGSFIIFAASLYLARIQWKER